MTSPKAKSSPPPPLRRVSRGAKTLFFLITMLASLLLFSAPLLVVVVDVLLPSVLLSAAFVSPLSAQTFSAQLRNYDFRVSLVDVPLVSIARSLVVLCVYCLCDGRGLSRGPYLGITMFCSLASVAYVSVKACVFGDLVRWHRDVTVGWREGLALEALFLSSLLLAAAHMVVAYRTSCRERRKLLVYRIDIEAVSTCKNGFPGYHKLCR